MHCPPQNVRVVLSSIPRTCRRRPSRWTPPRRSLTRSCSTFGITNNKLSVEQAKSEAVSGGNGWGDLCEAWGEAPRDLVTLRVKANSHTSSVMVSTAPVKSDTEERGASAADLATAA